jgi:hypothetical protein
LQLPRFQWCHPPEKIRCGSPAPKPTK